MVTVHACESDSDTERADVFGGYVSLLVLNIVLTNQFSLVQNHSHWSVLIVLRAVSSRTFRESVYT